MALIWKIFFILSISTCIFEKVICQSQSDSTYDSLLEGRLWDDVLYNYNKHLSATKPMSLMLAVQPIKIIKVDVENGHVTIDIWLTRSWMDNRLTWDPAEYSGITKIYIKPSLIYVPQIELYYGSTTNLMVDPEVVVHNDGHIHHVLPIRVEIFCSLPAIPFQHTVCNMTFGSWSRDDSQINITTKSDEYEIDPVGKEIGMCRIRSTRAIVKRTVYACCPESYSSLLVFLQINCYRSRASSSQAQLGQYRDLKHVGNENEFEKSSLPVVVAPFLVLLVFLLPRATDRVFLGAIVFLYLLLIWTSGTLTVEYQSFHRMSIWVTITATFASLMSCRLLNSAGVPSYETDNDRSQPKESSGRRRLAIMVDLMLFAASAVVLGIATAGLLT